VHVTADGRYDVVVFACLFVAGLILYADGWRRLCRYWLIANLPTSRVRSVAMGLAELSGKARLIDQSFDAPVRKVPCIWARTRVIRRTGSGKNESTSVVYDRSQAAPFTLEDETGRILVLPQGAEVVGDELCDVWIERGVDAPGDVADFCTRNGLSWTGWLDGSLRVTEWALLADTEVFVIGAVDRVNDPAGDRRRQVGDVLKGWLGSPARKAAIDANHDGIIDSEEWEKAKAQAQSDVLAAEGPPQGPDIAVRMPPSGLFLISPGSRKDALQAQGHPGLELAGGLVLVVVVALNFPFDEFREYGAAAIFGGGLAAAQTWSLWQWFRLRA
jgi:hypothetical protein